MGCKFLPKHILSVENLTTLPVSTSAVERSFSTLKRLKTSHSNKNGNESLTGLNLLSFH